MGASLVIRGNVTCGKFICYCYLRGRAFAAYRIGAYSEKDRLSKLAEAVKEAYDANCARLEVAVFSSRGVWG